jgi:hypothetical protein
MKNINISGLRRLSGSLFFLLISAGLFAQANFAGSWAFNESKSKLGDSQFRMAATAIVATQDAKVLTVETTRPGRDGQETKSTAKYNLDGTPSENPGFGNSVRKSTVTWSADKSSITIASTMSFDMNGETRTMNSSETWKLTEGGKVLLLDNVMPGFDGGEMKTTAAYDKK